MKKFILLIILLGIYSCTLTQDFKFYFSKNGQEFEATGTAAAPFVVGDELVIKIANEPRRKCVAILIDGNRDLRGNCKGKKGTFTVFNLGKINPRTSSVISMSVVRKGYTTMTGKLYLGLSNAQYEPVEIEYACPYQSQMANQFTCMRPKDFEFIFTVYPIGLGAIQIFSDDCAGEGIQIIKNIVEEISDDPGKSKNEIMLGKEWNIKIKRKTTGYCPIRVDFKSEEFKQSSTLHVDFYEI